MKKILLIFIIFFLSISMFGCEKFENPNTDYCTISNTKDYYVCEKRYSSYFDTTTSLKLFFMKNDNYNVNDIFTYLEDTLRTYHQELDRYKEYSGINNVYTINHSTGQIKISKLLFNAIKFGLDNEDLVLRDNSLVFNIALGPVLDIWHDARDNIDCDNNKEFGISYCSVPVLDSITHPMPINPNNINLNADDLTIEFLEDGMSLDLGGYGKGYVAKIITDHLDSLGVNYLINLGNSIVSTGGINPTHENGNYYVALIEPNTDNTLNQKYYEYVSIPKGYSLVTSGINQRFFKGLVDHKIYHHIIDPETYYPGGYCKSITILYNNPAIADIFSTAIFLLPIDDALKYVNETPGLEAVWYIDSETILYSNGFEAFTFDID